METIGRRVAHIRKAKGISQRQFADKMGYSVSWVKKVEGGSRPLDRYSVIADAAKALGVHVSELTEETVRVRDEHDAHEAVQQIRAHLYAGPSSEPDHRGVDAVVRDIRGAIATRQAGRFATFSRMVPDLLQEIEAATSTTTDAERERATAALVELLHGTAMLLRRLGHIDLAWIALHRAAAAIPGSGDPLLPAVHEWQTAETLFRAGQAEQALHAVDRGLGVLDEQNGTSPARDSLHGTLHLLHAIGAAQRDDTGRMNDAMAEARARAARVGAGRDDYQTVFGPAEVGIQAVAAAVELGEPDAALHAAGDVRPADVKTVERQARYQIDLARAYTQAGDNQAAYKAITRAYRHAPEYVRNHVMSREVVSWLIDRERRASMTGLRTLAKRMGVV